MSNSTAAAVLTTTDLPEAIRAVRTLLEISDGCPEVDLEAEITSPEVLARVLDVLPDLEWWSMAGPEHGSSEAGDDPADRLPVRVSNWSRPLDRAEPFIAALGSEPGALRWDLDGWPEVPEAELDPVTQKYAYLTLSVNSRDLCQDEPSEDHTVHVHVRSESETARIGWLADRIGGRFTGRTELSAL
ncbi:hypothetical protein [Streptomyces niveus]|uniref:hypothetical protein n=1 Tax=Streptomyces niveus TaxID=193462 RepID=UPI0037BB1C95